MASDRSQLKIRLSDEVADLVRQSAGSAGHSYSAEIEARLRRSYDQDATRQLIRDEVRQAIREERDFGPRSDPLAGATVGFARMNGRPIGQRADDDAGDSTNLMATCGAPSACEGVMVGRPHKHQGEGKSPPVTFRCRPALKDKLVALATSEGRSLSEVIERLLEVHFTSADMRQIIEEEIRAAFQKQTDTARTGPASGRSWSRPLWHAA